MKKSLMILNDMLKDPTLEAALKKIPLAEQTQIIDRHSQEAGRAVDSKPRFIHMAGIPGSGKSTLAQQLQVEFSTQHLILISFDNIMAALSGYQAINEPKFAFEQWELPARALGYVLIKHCLTLKLPILLDHSAANLNHLALLRALRQENDYELEMYFLEATPEKVLPLIKQREQQTQRHTPSELVFERHALMQQLKPLYEEVIPNFNVFSILDD